MTPAGLESLQIMLVSFGEERSLGAFSIDGDTFTGTGNCGTRSDGTFAPAADGGLDVTMTVTIPAGSRIGSGPATTEERIHRVPLHLTREQAEGKATHRVLLPGFGRARLRVVRGGR